MLNHRKVPLGGSTLDCAIENSPKKPRPRRPAVRWGGRQVIKSNTAVFDGKVAELQGRLQLLAAEAWGPRGRKGPKTYGGGLRKY